MRRKIAFGLAIALTAVLAVLQPTLIPATEGWSLFGLNVHTISIALVCLELVALSALCFTRRTPVMVPAGKWSTPCGWISTFCGAVLTMTVLLDLLFLWLYGEMPSPGVMPTSSFDYFLLVCTFLFGLSGGLYLVLQGFRWMSQKGDSPEWLRWMSLCPTLWMWFRLARYEISYASTLDIDESFFTFASLVFSSLFLLQFSRTVAGVGKTPKSSLLILALMTGTVTLAASPVAIAEQAVGAPLTDMLIIVVDAVIGLTAFFYAAMQVFSPFTHSETPADDGDDGDEDVRPESDTTDESSEDTALSWELPQKEHPPVEPPFAMDQLLPETAAFAVKPARYPQAKSKAAPAPDSSSANTTDKTPAKAPAPTVDELLDELENF